MYSYFFFSLELIKKIWMVVIVTVLGVVGSRSFSDYTKLQCVLNDLKFDSLVSGGAVGADSLAQRYSEDHGIPITVHLPNYSKYGRKAPIVRNKLIVDDADLVIAFWDGTSHGTRSSLVFAAKANLPTIIVFYITKKVNKLRF